MLPDRIRSKIAALLESISPRGTAVAICDARRQIEVEIGDVSAFLGLVGQAHGIFVEQREDMHVLVSERAGGYFLVAAVEDTHDLGELIGSLWVVGPELDALLSPDDPGLGPASAQALRAG